MLLVNESFKAESGIWKSGASVGVGKKTWRKVVANLGWATLKRVAWVVSHLLSFLVEYEYKVKVTFGLTNFSGFVGHERYASLFGAAREMFGLSRIPGFSKDAGHKYLLKTRDATYRHFDDFKFGDVIRVVVDVVEVNGASFRVRGRFINAKTGKVNAEAYQWIVYTNMVGRPTRFPFWLRVLLKFSERPIANNGKKSNNEDVVGYEVFGQEIVVTSAMTNAEKNVNHDEYAKIFVQATELFMFSRGQKCSLKVKEASYKYSQDFFFGDKMVVRLFIAETGSDRIIFEANFCGEAGKIHAHGRQEVHFISQVTG